jgi:hypothetical protein
MEAKGDKLLTTCIVIFAYNRYEDLITCLNSLSNCIGVEKINIHVYIDGPRNEYDTLQQLKISKLLCHQFKNLNFELIEFSPRNNGLKKSVINGITNSLNQYESVIVIEDDLILSVYFILYMLKNLNGFRFNSKIWSISGYKYFNKPRFVKTDSYLSKRHCSWGWATWRDRWINIDWSLLEKDNVSIFILFFRLLLVGPDLFSLAKDSKNSKIDSWSIIFDVNAALHRKKSVMSLNSYVKNNGFNSNGTHFKSNIMLPHHKYMLNNSYYRSSLKVVSNILFDIYVWILHLKFYYYFYNVFNDLTVHVKTFSFRKIFKL